MKVSDEADPKTRQSLRKAGHVQGFAGDADMKALVQVAMRHRTGGDADSRGADAFQEIASRQAAPNPRLRHWRYVSAPAVN